MKPFVVNELVVTSGGVFLKIAVFGNPSRRTKAFGVARWPVIARDALHSFLSQTWPSIKLRRACVPRGHDEQAWRTVLADYEKQATNFFARAEAEG